MKTIDLTEIKYLWYEKMRKTKLKMDNKRKFSITTTTKRWKMQFIA